MVCFDNDIMIWCLLWSTNHCLWWYTLYIGVAAVPQQEQYPSAAFPAGQITFKKIHHRRCVFVHEWCGGTSNRWVCKDGFISFACSTVKCTHKNSDNSPWFWVFVLEKCHLLISCCCFMIMCAFNVLRCSAAYLSSYLSYNQLAVISWRSVHCRCSGALLLTYLLIYPKIWWWTV